MNKKKGKKNKVIDREFRRREKEGMIRFSHDE